MRTTAVLKEIQEGSLFRLMANSFKFRETQTSLIQNKTKTILMASKQNHTKILWMPFKKMMKN
jgi:hypothetical protein